MPFGILLDYGMEFTGLAPYDGTILSDSTKTTYGIVNDIYNTLVASIIHTNAGPFIHPIYIDSVLQNLRQPGVITLGGLFYQYTRLADNAVSGGLITVTNNKLYDRYVRGIWRNPYITKNVFAFSPSINSYNSYGTYSLQVTLPSTLWLTNSASLIRDISADFADGIGFRTLTQDQLLNLAYTSGGIKTWTFKLTMNSGTILQPQTDIKLDSSGILGAVKKKSSTSGLSKLNPITKSYFSDGYTAPAQPVTADLAFYNQTASGFMTIHYASFDGILRKPLIVAEGYDPGDIFSPEYRFGIRYIIDFLDDVANSTSNNLQNLLTDNMNAQYNGSSLIPSTKQNTPLIIVCRRVTLYTAFRCLEISWESKSDCVKRSMSIDFRCPIFYASAVPPTKLNDSSLSSAINLSTKSIVPFSTASLRNMPFPLF